MNGIDWRATLDMEPNETLNLKDSVETLAGAINIIIDEHNALVREHNALVNEFLEMKSKEETTALGIDKPRNSKKKSIGKKENRNDVHGCAEPEREGGEATGGDGTDGADRRPADEH